LRNKTNTGMFLTEEGYTKMCTPGERTTA